MARPAQELRVDEKLEELQARRLVEAPEALSLLAGQAQSGHLQELAIHAPEQRIVYDRPFDSHRRLLALTPGCVAGVVADAVELLHN
jgi:hypothetical protein